MLFAGLHCAALTAPGPTGSRRGSLQATREPARGQTAPRRCTCTSGASAASLCAFGGAPSNRRWQAVPWSPLWRLTWTLSTCSGAPSVRAFAAPCCRIFRKPRPGQSGSIHLTPSSLLPREPSVPPTGELSKETRLAPVRPPWFWVKRGKPNFGTTTPLPSSTKASATSDLLMTGRSSSGRGRLTGGSAPWMPPWPRSGPPAAALRVATQRVPAGSSVHVRGRASFWAETPRSLCLQPRLGHHRVGDRLGS